MHRTLVFVMFVASWLLPRLVSRAEPSFVPARPEDMRPRSTSGPAPVFTSARSVEVFRVAPPSDKRKTTGRVFHGQKIIVGPRQLSPESARALGKELERVYVIDWPPLYCAFVPRYGVRLQFPAHSVEVLVCPHCGEVQFSKGREWFRSASVTARLFRLLEKAFPDYPLRANET